MTGTWRPPEFYLLAGGASVEVPGRVAAWLDARVGLRRLAQQTHGDPETRAVLQALAVASAEWQLRCARGSTPRNLPEGRPPSGVMTTAQAATALRVTDRAVRLALEEGRLLGVKGPAGHWRVQRADVEAYRDARTA